MSEMKDVRVKALQDAVDALKPAAEATGGHFTVALEKVQGLLDEAIAALEPAPKPAGGGEVEPVAWLVDHDAGSIKWAEGRFVTANEAEAVNWSDNGSQVTPLYAAPPAPATSPSGGEVAVKPLEWRLIGKAWVAGTEIGAYEVICFKDEGLSTRLKKPLDTVGSWFPSEAKAKAAAQADFEQRIRSALTSPEAPQSSEVVRALQLHVAYEALPADRGGKNGPKGQAWQAFIAARDAALAKIGGDHDK